MSKELKKDWLPKLQARYGRRGREGKSLMLDELCDDYNYERKYAIKLLRGGLPAPTGRVYPGPERQYEVVEPVVRQIWLTAEQPCGKRLVPVLRQWLPYYEERYGELSARQRSLIRQVSPATLDRLLAPARVQHWGRGRSGTKPGSLLRSEIPIRAGTWDLKRPGYLEADSVAHCGTSLAGSFIWSLTYTDILSGWTEGGAVWNKGAAGVLSATREVEQRLPFALLGFDSDNGGEFLNHHLWAYMRDRKVGVEFTRSRPYHSDDNAHVEQKNWTWARQLLGYGRLEDPELVAPISALYREVWAPWQNFFLPCLKLEQKCRIARRAIHAVFRCRHDGDGAFPSECDLKDEVTFLHQEQILLTDFKSTARRFVKDAASETVDSDFLIYLFRFNPGRSTLQAKQITETNFWPRFHRALLGVGSAEFTPPRSRRDARQ